MEHMSYTGSWPNISVTSKMPCFGSEVTQKFVNPVPPIRTFVSITQQLFQGQSIVTLIHVKPKCEQ